MLKLSMLIGASAVGAALADTISCASWVENSGTICFRGVAVGNWCNPATFTNSDSCGEQYCCLPVNPPPPPPPPAAKSCMKWVNDNGVQCNNGVQDRNCDGYGEACSKDYCCKPFVRVMSDCWQWTSGAAKCPSGPKKPNYENILKDYQCFEKVNLDKQPMASQNGIGPCSMDQCCAMIQGAVPDNNCKNYPPYVPAPEKNYDWNCECWAAANNYKCSSGKILQVGKLCTRWSKKYPGVPKCTKGNCCKSTPWVYSGEPKPQPPSANTYTGSAPAPGGSVAGGSS
eukprot:comp10834_c0_seq1/m.5462 comp10834_c0_seq1/g.5462  ORF comp10834_c0_seq1/g.5462 comp10834_c0_seq1/m.5462 type:complete len:285 (-) comp10834_c0_seq1:363-1217(-)